MTDDVPSPPTAAPTPVEDAPATPEVGRTATGTAPRGKPDAGKGNGQAGTIVGRKKSRWSFLTEFPALVVISLALALLIKTFLFQAFFIPSESMVPTLQIGDRVLVNKVVYHLHPPRRGDVIVFADPHPAPEEDRNPVSAFWHWLTEGLGLSTNPEKDFIKRVIALPGETIEIHGGTVFINGLEIQDEPYLSPVKDVSDYGPYTVPPNHVFVMGDNRTQSSDSRTLLGPIPYDKIIGRAFVIMWPPSRMGWLHGYDYSLSSPAPSPS
jgi:signal peptidase I